VNWYRDIIDTLLDHGADVNKLNTEGMSALAACAVFFYPIDRFLYNIAERYMEKPPEVEMEQDPNVQGILVSESAKTGEYSLTFSKWDECLPLPRDPCRRQACLVL
jgi:hypothetical protein